MAGELGERVIRGLDRRFPGRVFEAVNDGMEGLAEAVADVLASVPIVVIALAVGFSAWRGHHLVQGVVAITAVHVAWYLGPQPELSDTVALAALVGLTAWSVFAVLEWGWASLVRRAAVRVGALRRVTPGHVERPWRPVAFAAYLAAVITLGLLAIQQAGPGTAPAVALFGAASVLAASHRRGSPSGLLHGPRVGEALLAGLLISVAMGAGLNIGLGGLLMRSVVAGHVALAVEVALSALALGVAACALLGDSRPSSGSANSSGDGQRSARCTAQGDASDPGPDVLP